MYRAFFLAVLLVASPIWAQAAQPSLVASVRPLGLLLQELTQGTPLQVHTLLPKGATPHDYSLKPSDLRAIQSAEWVVWLGPNSEPYLKKVMQKAGQSLAWESVPGLHTLPLREDDHHHDHHGHHHESMDPHIWFSVKNAEALVNDLYKRISQQHPKWQPALENNKAQILQRLHQQQQQMRGLLALKPQPFMLAHDAYQYLEQDLGISASATVVLDPEIKPGAKHIMAVKKKVAEEAIACVVTDPIVSSGLLKKIDSQSRLTQVSIDPLAWDFDGNEYSLWLSSVYVKMLLCAAES